MNRLCVMLVTGLLTAACCPAQDSVAKEATVGVADPTITAPCAAKPTCAASCADEPGCMIDPSAPTVSASFPMLGSGPLAKARMVDLDKGVLLCAPDIVVRQEEIESIVSAAPENKREALRANSFVILEQIAAQKLIVQEARLDGFVGDDDSVLRDFTAGIVKNATVSDQEVKEFFDANPGILGSQPFGRMKLSIRERLLKTRRQELIAAHEAGLAERAPVCVDAAWIKAQAEALGNIDSNTPSGEGKLTREQVLEYLKNPGSAPKASR